MTITSLTAISPIDGRYNEQTEALSSIFSEFGLISNRVRIEIQWLLHLINHPEIKEIPRVNKTCQKEILDISHQFSIKEAKRVKALEKTTRHDVKAVEYYIKEKLAKNKKFSIISEFTHFACTSEDINNLAYALMIKKGRGQVLQPLHDQIIQKLTTLARKHAHQPMLSRTHGQAATPTTVGKEFANMAYRCQQCYERIHHIKISGKFNGAVGNFNAHCVAYPKIDWIKSSKAFIKELGLAYNPMTTQIEPHDYIVELSHAIAHFNSILIDLCRDVWGYISLDYLSQKTKASEVGSSTMPHKVNPIDFENAEGNLGLANALFQHFSAKLPISRWQRDLSDSTVLRNIGVAFAYSSIAYQSVLKGLDKIAVNTSVINADLDDHWQVLAEPIQTVMRRYHIDKPYEKLKALTRGQMTDKNSLHRFIDNLAIPDNEKTRLKKLTPALYIGYAAKLAKL